MKTEKKKYYEIETRLKKNLKKCEEKLRKFSWKLEKSLNLEQKW